MEPIKVDFVKRQIVMTSKFAAAASKPHTNEAEILREQIEAFPKFRVVKHTIKHNEGRECYKGLTYERMREHIIEYNVDLLEEFERQVYLSSIHSIRYPAIKSWFLKVCPEVKNYGKRYEKVDAEEINFEEIA